MRIRPKIDVYSLCAIIIFAFYCKICLYLKQLQHYKMGGSLRKTKDFR